LIHKNGISSESDKTTGDPTIGQGRDLHGLPVPALGNRASIAMRGARGA
jgi:hypothetical protein